MKYFLDSAKVEEIDTAYHSFGIEGVTTNPNHVMNSGLSNKEVVRNLATWAAKVGVSPEEFPISIEINPHLNDAQKMLSEAEEIAAISPYFVVKIPCTLAGITAARQLEQKGIRTNVTLIFSPSQALAAARAGASFISPFVGWKEANGEDCLDYLNQIRVILDNFPSLQKTQVITAALRTGKQIADAASIGMDIVTCGLAIYQDSTYHPFTDFGLNKFQNAWDATSK